MFSNLLVGLILVRGLQSEFVEVGVDGWENEDFLVMLILSA